MSHKFINRFDAENAIAVEATDTEATFTFIMGEGEDQAENVMSFNRQTMHVKMVTADGMIFEGDLTFNGGGVE